MIVAASTTDVLRLPVLVLNRNFQPIRFVTVRLAFEMMFVGRARALDRNFTAFDFCAWSEQLPSSGEDAIRTPAGEVRVPRVLMLPHYSRVPTFEVRLSRTTIFLRDRYRCQYCARTLPTQHLNLDHVLPRSRGGKSTWDNLVTSCIHCNLRKGGRLPSECGMTLLKPPVRPPWTTSVELVTRERRYEEWEVFLPAALPREDAA